MNDIDNTDGIQLTNNLCSNRPSLDTGDKIECDITKYNLDSKDELIKQINAKYIHDPDTLNKIKENVNNIYQIDNIFNDDRPKIMFNKLNTTCDLYCNLLNI
jgi:hypothetical protein